MTDRMFVSKDVSYKCPYCGFEFSNLGAYRTHVERIDKREMERVNGMIGRMFMTRECSDTFVCGTAVSYQHCTGLLKLKGIRLKPFNRGEWSVGFDVSLGDDLSMPPSKLEDYNDVRAQSRYMDIVKRMASEITNSALMIRLSDEFDERSVDSIDPRPEVVVTPTYYCSHCAQAFTNERACAEHASRCYSKPVLNDDSKVGFEGCTNQARIFGKMHRFGSGRGYYSYVVMLIPRPDGFEFCNAKDEFAKTPRFDLRENIRDRAVQSVVEASERLMERFLGGDYRWAS